MRTALWVRLLITLLALLALTFLWRALPNLPGLSRPVEIRDLSASPGVSRTGETFRLSNKGPALPMVTGSVHLRPDSVYRISFSLADPRSTAPFTLIYDLCAPGYDNPEQQGHIGLLKYAGKQPVSRLVPTGSCPPEAALRIFLTEPGEVSVSKLRVERLNSAVRYARFAVLTLGAAAMAYLFYCVRSVWPQLASGAALAAVVLLLLTQTSPPPATDAHWTVPAVHSLFTQGDLELSEFRHDPIFTSDDGLEQGLDGIYYRYPVGMPLLAMPAVFLGALYSGGDLEAVHVFAGRAVFAAAIVAFFLLAARVSGSEPKAALLTLIFALATPNFPTLGGGLWTHGGTQLLLCVAALLLWIGREPGRENWTIAASLPLALSYLVRPSNAVPILIFTLYVAFGRRQVFLPYALTGAFVALAFVAWSYSIYAEPLPPYYTMKLHGGRFWEALAGHLISPNRGLFIWCPFYLFSLYGVWKWARGGEPLLKAFAATVPVGFLVICLWPVWWGGFSIGPRLLSDLLPFLTLTLLPALDCLQSRRNWPVLALFGVLVVWSVFVQVRGAAVPEVSAWNADSVHQRSIDQDPSRAWDWRDMQMLRGL